MWICEYEMQTYIKCHWKTFRNNAESNESQAKQKADTNAADLSTLQVVSM